jgi:uncharacterized protein
MQQYRSNKTLAYTVPCVVFMMFKGISDTLHSNKAGAPWWLSAPEQWIYPLQTLCVLGILWWWRAQYRADLTRPSPKALLWGAAAGLLGLALWLLPNWIWQYTEAHGGLGLPDWLAKPLGIKDRHGKGFNPDVFSRDSLAYYGAVSMRFVRMGLAVPIFEELFWRSFLWRYASAEHTDKWWKIPFAQPWSRGFWAVLILWPLAHGVEDYLGCIIYAIVIGTVAMRTKSLWACVMCHAVTNLGLGWYVMKTGLWTYW